MILTKTLTEAINSKLKRWKKTGEKMMAMFKYRSINIL
jgi:hypothetical protein